MEKFKLEKGRVGKAEDRREEDGKDGMGDVKVKEEIKKKRY